MRSDQLGSGESDLVARILTLLGPQFQSPGFNINGFRMDTTIPPTLYKLRASTWSERKWSTGVRRQGRRFQTYDSFGPKTSGTDFGDQRIAYGANGQVVEPSKRNKDSLERIPNEIRV